MNSINRLFLLGFRATGKSTIGPLIAKKLGWKYIEMDNEIVRRSKKEISELTKQGTEWQLFRQMEHDLLKELLKKNRIVVSAGGGVGVNSVIKDGTSRTFGEMNASLLKKNPLTLQVVLTAKDKIIEQRIRSMEEGKKEIYRPILNEKKARKLVKRGDKHAYIETMVNDSLAIYRQRKPLYTSLGHCMIDTGTASVAETVSQILSIL